MKNSIMKIVSAFLGLGALVSFRGGYTADFPDYEDLVPTNAMLEVEGYKFTGGMLKKENGKPTCNGEERGEASWSGSGFLVKNDGTLVTNFHVASKALKANAIFENGARYEVRYIKAYDDTHDLATMQLYGTGRFPTVRLGNSDKVQPRDAVMAVGSPGGRGLNITEGKVSQVVKDDYGNPVRLRHTAPIAPGNSGGALYKGDEVIGVNTSTWTGYQFHMATPINFAKVLLQPEFDKASALDDAFLPDTDRLIKQLKPLDSTTGKLAGKAVNKHVVEVGALSDMMFLVKNGSGADLDLYLYDEDGNMIGCAQDYGTEVEGLMKTFVEGQRVTLAVQNVSDKAVSYGLSLVKIEW